MLKVDFHVHSNLSYDGSMSLDQIAKAAKLAGLDAVCISDHNSCALDKITEKDGVILLPGCEISSSKEHIVAMLYDAKPDIEALRKNGIPSPKDVIDEIRKCGGVAVIAHPYSHTDKEKWNGSGLCPDAVEQYNARAWMKCLKANELAAEYAKSVGVPCIGGSDAHLAEEIGNAYTLVDCNDASEIKEALLSGKTKAVLKQNTKRIYKGRSQIIRSKKQGGIKRRLLAYGVFLKCMLLDFLGL